jgi:RNA polymerase sigma-70 factor (ECF subfamily)
VTPDQDQADVHRVLAGEPQAFEGIVQRWQRPLVNLAWRYCHDRGRAEEWAQDAFVQSFRQLSSWKGDAVFSTWLFAVASNLYRSRMRRWIPPSVSLDHARELSDPRSEFDGLEVGDTAAAVRRAVMFLPARYRDAVVLYYFHDMEIGAAAKSLGVPEGTVKARLARGRDLLRRKLERSLSARPLEQEA